MGVYIGLDIGGTKFMVAAAGEDGSIFNRVRESTKEHWKDDLELLNRMISQVADGERILGIGAAIGGPLDWEKGIVSPLHQPTWREVPLKAIMEERWGCSFYVDVDTNVAALGEYAACSPKPYSLLYITLSTGMGGGFIVEGKIYRGAGGVHPEIGHQAIPNRCSNPAAVQCECGVPDCLEGLISGNAIRRIYGKPAEELDEKEWEEVAYNLGQGLRNLTVIYAPEEIRLGGGVAVGGGERLLQAAKNVMEEHLFLVPAPVVSLSRLGYDTALIGALTIARTGLA
ncbi:MAG: ROK family protein [Chloroflexi bacterium]|nr:MAG: ROK family protein [Chloroflexota bacterium]